MKSTNTQNLEVKNHNQYKTLYSWKSERNLEIFWKAENTNEKQEWKGENTKEKQEWKGNNSSKVKTVITIVSIPLSFLSCVHASNPQFKCFYYPEIWNLKSKSDI